MKLATLAVAAVMTIGTIAQAYPYGRYHDGWRRGGYDRGGGWHRHHDSDVAVGVACAPEVLQGNVAATDRTVNALVASPDFANATQFKAAVKEIQGVHAADERAAAYMDLVGINLDDKNAVANFIGARDVSQAQVVELQRNTGLSDAQANKVASSLQSALRGNLQ